jgi:hypothetical protein
VVQFLCVLCKGGTVHGNVINPILRYTVGAFWSEIGVLQLS